MNFNWKNEYEKINQQTLINWRKKWEKLDNKLFKNKDSKYKMVKFKTRTLQTKIGLLKFKRRVYKYYNTITKKWIYVSLLDNYLGIEKYCRLSKDVFEHITKFLGDGKRYRDIIDTLPLIKISNMSISRIFNKIKIEPKKIDKIKLQDNQYLYINIDDCFVNEYKIRPISFNTGRVFQSKNRNKLLNKRISFELTKNNLLTNKSYYLQRKATINWIKNELNRFFDNWENAQLIVGGDGANWITSIANSFEAKQVLCNFHIIQHIRKSFIIIRNTNYRYIDYNSYQEFWKALSNYDLQKAIEILENFKSNLKKQKIYLGKIRKTQIFITYIKRNWQSFLNHSQKWNIGVSAESDVYHLVKSQTKCRNYGFKSLNNILIARANNINCKI